ncbi:MAG TPA: ABC transporter permease [Candidatus Acidoferrales bacterium]|nr:ABC transporter permease [Candidatus Acidoferrales bacterium]
MENLWKDIRFGLRMLAQKPGFTAIAVLTLALGIGANTAIFTLFDSVLLQKLPVRDPGQLVLFTNETGEGTRSSDSVLPGHWDYYSWENYQYLRQEPLPFTDLAAYRSGQGPVSVRMPGANGGDAQVQRATVHPVSGNFFDVMGVPAALGRTLEPSDDQRNAPPTAVASYDYWKQHLNGDRGAVGRTVILNSTSFTIVGVMPQSFFGERVRTAPNYWVPLSFQSQIELRPSYLDDPNAYWLNLIARIKPGVTMAQAQAAATIALQQFLLNKQGSKLTPEDRQNIAKVYVGLFDGSTGVSHLRDIYSQPLRILLAVVAMVLLIACANVGNLMLSRASARQTEISVRLALGASKLRLIRQLLTESLLLALVGGACGIMLAHWGVDLLVTALAKNSPMKPHLNGPVLLFTIGVTVFAGILFGLAPALYARKTDLASALRAGSKRVAGGDRKWGTTQILVIAQIAISLVLLVGSNLFARSLVNLERQKLGFDASHVLLAQINPRLAGYKPENAAPYYMRLTDAINRLPGVSSGTIARYSPLSGSESTSNISVQGYAAAKDEDMDAHGVTVASHYLETMGITLLLGREIDQRDGATAPKVAMVNEAFIRRYLPRQDPIGAHFGFGDEKHAGDMEIIGVTQNAQFSTDVRDPIEPMVFQPYAQEQDQMVLSGEVAIRTTGNPDAAASELRQAIADVDPTVPISGVQTLATQVSENFEEQRIAAQLITFFGGLALLLACIGLYGIVAQGVARRTNEIGVRMSMGAQPGDILRMILRDTLILVAVGLAIGLPAAFGATRLISSQLYGVGAADLLSFVAAIVILAAVSALAGFLPARRAARVDPMVALRYE